MNGTRASLTARDYILFKACKSRSVARFSDAGSVHQEMTLCFPAQLKNAFAPAQRSVV
jgi:hypothetical protein